MSEWPAEIREVIGRLLDGEYEPDDAGRLVTWLREHPDQRAAVYALFEIDGLLQVEADFDPEAFVAGVETRIAAATGEHEFVEMVGAVIADESQFVRESGWRLLPWLLAAAAGVALVVSNWPGMQSEPAGVVQDPVPVATVVDETLVALLVNEVDAEFAGDGAPDGVRFQAGRYELLAGAVHLRFVNGVDVVARAPAEWVIVHAMRMQLVGGAMRAFVPEAGKGFSIDVPGAVYEDIGTEFGVQVNGDASELHVFSGAVKVHREQQSTLYEMGQSIRVAEDGVTAAVSPDMELYPTPADLHYLRWCQLRSELPASPGLIGYLTMDNAVGERLPNLAPGEAVSDGRVVQARWVTGRWAKKPALLFDAPGDRVELSVKGNYQQATLALWCKVDRVDVPHTSLVSSDGAEPGDVHWKIDRDGRTDLALRAAEGWRQLRGLVVPFGQWLHLVVSLDLARARARFFVNGSMVAEGPMPVPSFAPGSLRLGDWLPEPGHPQVTRARGFHGRMGEFAVWDRELSMDEVRQLWRRGTPDMVAIAAE